MKTIIKYITVFCFVLGTSIVISQESIPYEEMTPVENALTGISSAVSGGWAVVASPQKDNVGKKSAGGVTFYRLTDGQWKQFQEVLPSDASELGNFGTSVALDGTTAVISAVGDHQGALFSGAVYVYNYDYLQESWVQTAKLKASDVGMGKRYGHCVDILGDMIVVGAYNADGNETKSGAGYVYKKMDDEWIERQKLFTEDGKSNDYFGHHVKILNENYVAVGAYNTDGAEERSGAVYIFKQIEGIWVEQVKLFDPNGESSDLFGFSLSVVPELDNAQNNGRFPGILFVGAPGSQQNNQKTGSVYLYTEDETGWTLGLKLIESETDHNDHFGASVSANKSGGLFVGASRSNSNANLNAGKVYYYETLAGAGTSVVPVTNLSAAFEKAYDQFGTHIATDEENIIIGAPYADTDGLTNSGTIHFFRMSALINSETNIADVYSLDQNVPNPSMGTTVIPYGLKQGGNVKISLYNINGQLISVLLDDYREFGEYTYNLDTRKFATGIYIYKIEVNDFSAEKKMVIGR
jgi:hypothetical protein